MREFLLGVPGKLATLLTRIPSTVASDTKIQTVDDNVDTLITRVTGTVALGSDLSSLDTDVAAIPTTIATVQSGFLDDVSTTTDSGEDVIYYNRSISAVSDITKCMIILQGSVGTTNSGGAYFYGTTSVVQILRGRLTSTTNLRISASRSVPSGSLITCRWQVIEFS